MSDMAWPETLQDIIEEFEEADPEERLEMLLEFAMNMPELPEELLDARDSMEQVHECQSPVFLLAKIEDGKVYYHLDVPREAPTVRGFAGILYEGLNGAEPEAIIAAPNDLSQRLGLHKVLTPLRMRGLSALLGRMKRNAQELGGVG